VRGGASLIVIGRISRGVVGRRRHVQGRRIQPEAVGQCLAELPPLQPQDVVGKTAELGHCVVEDVLTQVHLPHKLIGHGSVDAIRGNARPKSNEQHAPRANIMRG